MFPSILWLNDEPKVTVRWIMGNLHKLGLLGVHNVFAAKEYSHAWTGRFDMGVGKGRGHIIDNVAGKGGKEGEVCVMDRQMQSI